MQPGPTRVTDGDAALLAAVSTPGGIHRVIELSKYCAGIVEKSTASVRQHYTTRLAMEEPHIDFALNVLDLPAQRRWLNSESLSGSREVSFLGDGNEISEVPELHGVTQRVMILLVAYHGKQLSKWLAFVSLSGSVVRRPQASDRGSKDPMKEDNEFASGSGTDRGRGTRWFDACHGPCFARH
jgi:hypothetical protein